MEYYIIRGELYVKADRDVWHMIHNGFGNPVYWTWENIPLDTFRRLWQAWLREENDE